MRGPILVDGHVHIHDSHDPAVVLDAALANFRDAAARLGLGAPVVGCLLFTESAGDHKFRQLRGWALEGQRLGPWAFRPTGEASSCLAVREDGPPLVLVAGRQIVTRERLEVLALGSDRDFPDGTALAATLAAVLDQGAIAVLPWGFGKWWFGRGAIMARAVTSVDPARVFLGDNGGRARALPRPRLFAAGAARGLKTLPGSDPLPFASEAGRAGGTGFVLAADLDAERPAEGLKAALRALAAQPTVYGHLEGLVRFGRNQVKMQLRKRM